MRLIENVASNMLAEIDGKTAEIKKMIVPINAPRSKQTPKDVRH
jgi:hypothetical protein